MAAKNAAQVARKWQRNIAAATESIKTGVMAVDESPTEKAASRAEAMVAGVQRAVSEGRWQAGLRRITKDMWQKAMIDKGLPRIATGAAAAEPKMQAFLADFLPFQADVVSRVNATLPRGDLETNINRAVEVMRGTSAYRRRSS